MDWDEFFASLRHDEERILLHVLNLRRQVNTARHHLRRRVLSSGMRQLWEFRLGQSLMRLHRQMLRLKRVTLLRPERLRRA